MRFRALVCLWLASAATARPSDAPTPTAGPTQGLTTEICADDDATWYHKNRGPDFDCAWVAQKPETRCSVNGATSSGGEAVVARDACAAACSECNGWYASNRLRTAVALWFSDRAAAEKEHGHISTWDTSGVTDMSLLFKGASSFNEDISAWDTSGVTSMFAMFALASAFNQDLGDWAVHNVKSMSSMFEGALAFEQDLGWCVADDVDPRSAFTWWKGVAPCSSTWCGVTWGGCDVPNTGNVMANGKIRSAVAAWLANATAAEATYGHISTWETGGVTDMSCLFAATSGWACSSSNTAAASFNEDIGPWNTSGVRTMDSTFKDASAFNQDIGDWVVDGVKHMEAMLDGASAFDQDLGWRVDDDVWLGGAFEGTPCESTSCGVQQGTFAPTYAPTTSPAPTVTSKPTATPLVADDSTIRTAVALWFSDRAAAEATYGHISKWETGGVTDMSFLFCGSQFNWACNTAAASFNEDIGAWDTSGVTTTYAMFYKASSFNQPIGNWRVDNVTSMTNMFIYASAFDQDLGWCVADDVNLHDAFDDTLCESTSCGVVQEYGGCAPSPAPTPGTDAARRGGRVAVVALVVCGIAPLFLA